MKISENQSLTYVDLKYISVNKHQLFRIFILIVLNKNIVSIWISNLSLSSKLLNKKSKL